MDFIVKAIEKKKINKIKLLINNNNKRDILYEMYDKNELSEKKLKFIIEKCSNYLYISTPLIERLIKEDNYQLFSIIIENLNFFDNKFILNILLFHYKNKTPISTSDLKQQISKYKFKLNKYNIYRRNTCGNYLEEACSCGNENVFFFLIRHGIVRKNENIFGETLLFEACR
ncbi:hypothetical protein BCR32DRAFT_60472, partial [Anaeromyces robustus]